MNTENTLNWIEMVLINSPTEEVEEFKHNIKLLLIDAWDKEWDVEYRDEYSNHIDWQTSILLRNAINKFNTHIEEIDDYNTRTKEIDKGAIPLEYEGFSKFLLEREVYLYQWPECFGIPDNVPKPNRFILDPLPVEPLVEEVEEVPFKKRSFEGFKF